MEHIENSSTKKLIILVVLYSFIIIALIGYTFSYFNAKVKNESYISGTVATLSLSLNITKISPSNSNNLIPQLDDYITSAVIGRNGSCVDDNNNNVCQVYEIKVKNTSEVAFSAEGVLFLNSNDNPNLKWARISGTTNPTLISGVNTPSIKLLAKDEFFSKDEEKTYYIVIWISETGESQYDTGNFTGKVIFRDNNIQYDDVDYSGANAPKLVDGLIPVYYNENSQKWITTDEYNENTIWYNYGKKKWANAILVDSSVRESYLTPNTPVDITKVLAFYVWIPRYKYKVWNINKNIGTDTYGAFNNGIDIIFESSKGKTGTIICDEYDFKITEGNGLSETCSDVPGGNGYYTHPAFKFGDNEITGFWMGKFEISNTVSLIKTIPNVKTLVKLPVSTLWNAIYNIQNNTYGLSTNRTKLDSHMLTNLEWGAVAYLTHSKYGRCTNGTCTEIAKNNSADYYTGRSAGEPPSDSVTEVNGGSFTYENPKGQLASTTGNIYGIYDMSGGATEYVMANLGASSTAGTKYTYYANGADNNFSYVGNEKYITTYSYGVNTNTQSAYDRGRLGDATSEVVTTNGVGWYGDLALLPYSSYSWYTRGGYSSLSADGDGIFLVAYNRGGSVASYTARAVLTPIK